MNYLKRIKFIFVLQHTFLWVLFAKNIMLNKTTLIYLFNSIYLFNIFVQFNILINCQKWMLIKHYLIATKPKIRITWNAFLFYGIIYGGNGVPKEYTVEHRLSAALGGRSIADNPKNRVKWDTYMKKHNLPRKTAKKQCFIVQKQHNTVTKMNN